MKAKITLTFLGLVLMFVLEMWISSISTFLTSYPDDAIASSGLISYVLLAVVPLYGVSLLIKLWRRK